MGSGQPQLLLITGPAGAGKSEVAELWAGSRAHTCARVTPDNVWDLIKAGRVDAVKGWSDEHRRQHQITLDGAAALVRNFLENDVSVAVDDVVFPAWPESGLEAWQSRLPEVDLELVVLMPSWDVIVQRNARRSGRDNLPQKMLRKIFDDMQPWLNQTQWPLIDNSGLSVQETVLEIEGLISGQR